MNWLAGFLDDGGEGRRVDKTHEEEGLKDGVGELRGLLEEFGCFRGVAHDKTFHLREDVEELGQGRVESVCEMASGQVRLGVRSTPGGRGGRPLACVGWAEGSESFCKGAS